MTMRPLIKRMKRPGRNVLGWFLLAMLGLAWMFRLTEAQASESVALIPKPAKMRVSEGKSALTAQTKILVTDQTERAGLMLARWLATDTGLVLPVERNSSSAEEPDTIILRLLPEQSSRGTEGYSLQVLPRQIQIQSASQAGLIFGCQSLRQLLTPTSLGNQGSVEGGTWTIPIVEVEDSPRLSWRGLMLDCSRTFLDTAYLKRTIELMSYHKLNVLHLHLTDDQGWRIEIKKHPKLTTIGSQFAPRYIGERGGYYSQAEIRDLIRYAADRGVTLVPEIEMPGHCTAALAAYPGLSCSGGPFEIFPFFKGPNIQKDVFCAGNEQTFKLLEDVLDEVCELFPSQYIHVGGDECPKDRWKRCPKCQARMQAEGLNDENELQGYFVRRIARFLETKKKRVLGWDEITEGGLPQSAAVMFWRGLEGVEPVAGAGHDLVLSPTTYCYLDYKQSDLPQERGEGGFPIPLDKIYSYDPIPSRFGQALAKHILGTQGNMWTHYARTEEEIDRQIYPRLAALAEVAWTPQALREWSDFRERMTTHCKRLHKMGVKMGINLQPDPAVWADPAMKHQ